MTSKSLVLSEAEFDEWKNSFATQSVLKVLATHAFDLKIDALEVYWNNNQLEDQPQLYAEKRAAQAKIELIEDLHGMTYEQLKSYIA
jgi:hypothetical protein